MTNLGILHVILQIFIPVYVFLKAGEGPNGYPGGGFGGFGGFGGGGFGGFDINDLFSQSRFGGGSASRFKEHPGDDLLSKMTIGFMDAVKGTKKDLTYDNVVKCSPCSGSGIKPGKKATTCNGCVGSGQVIE